MPLAGDIDELHDQVESCRDLSTSLTFDSHNESGGAPLWTDVLLHVRDRDRQWRNATNRMQLRVAARPFAALTESDRRFEGCELVVLDHHSAAGG